MTAWLRQRTALLKTAAGQRPRDAGLLQTLEVWDGHLAEHGARLLAARVELVNELRPEVEKAYQLLAPGSRAADIRYRSSVEFDAGGDGDSFETALLAALAARRDAELDRGVCLVGPHRDDLELVLGDQIAKGFASHGESWSMALSLRLAAYELLRSEGTDPVLLLDDVFAELDTARRRSLAVVAGEAEQVLLTAAVPDDIPLDLDARRITIGLAEDDGGPGVGGDAMTDDGRDSSAACWRRPAAPRGRRVRTSDRAASRRGLRAWPDGRAAAVGPGLGPGPDARDPQLLGTVTRNLAATRGWSARVAEGTVFGSLGVGGRRADLRPRLAHRPARRGAERDGGVNRLGHSVADDAGATAGQDRRGGRGRCRDGAQDHRSGRAVVAEGAASGGRPRPSGHVRMTGPS